MPEGYEVIDRYCGGDTWSYSGAQLAVSVDQLELSCDDEAVGIRSAFGTRIVPWSTVIEWRVNITKWKNDNTSDVGELWFGVVEVGTVLGHAAAYLLRFLVCRQYSWKDHVDDVMFRTRQTLADVLTNLKTGWTVKATLAPRTRPTVGVW